MSWKDSIQLQIDAHKQLNLLSPRHFTGFQFSDAMRHLIRKLAANTLSDEEEQSLLLYTTEVTLSSFYRLNQFYQFNNDAQKQLRHIYQQLLLDIKAGPGTEPNFDSLAATHYLRLQAWLVAHHPEISLLYPATRPIIDNPVACAEYSVSTQLETLGVNIQTLKEPVVDVGCGKEHLLVTYLQQKGLNAFGIDRGLTPGEKLTRKNWMDFPFTPDYWGTIISHLGFTNYFNHHHLKVSIDHLQYAEKYVEILRSLKVGGRFYYAPDLPFIERYLNPSQYSIRKKQVHQTRFYSVCIERLQ